jgi:hypothetical protein
MNHQIDLMALNPAVIDSERSIADDFVHITTTLDDRNPLSHREYRQSLIGLYDFISVNPNQKEITARSGFLEKVDVAIMKQVSNGVHIYAHDYSFLKVTTSLS